jgi:two-component system NtrC family sensor kinase
MDFKKPLLGELFLSGRDAVDASSDRYRVLRRKIVILMLSVSIIPLVLMATMNYYQYRKVLWNEIIDPLRALVNKTKHSFELFAAQRVSTVNFIASAYSYEQLSDERTLRRLFGFLRNEYKDFVDLGLIDCTGKQVSYAGPYELAGKDYSQQEWFQEVKVKGVYISDVFMGYRKFPHFAIAVKRSTETGNSWIVRATINTEQFENLIASMGMTPQSDAFLIDRQGVLQTTSKYFGKVFEKISLPVPPAGYEPSVIETVDPMGRDVILVYAYLLKPDMILMAVKPEGLIFKGWAGLRSELLAVFIISVVMILAVVFRVTDRVFERLRESDEEREIALREMEHNQKLSSIGRLAAGVAHEINNPVAVIGEKAGLAKDLIAAEPEFPKREKFDQLMDSIAKAVDRCGTITHRLLGFARRMDVHIEVLDLGSLLKEVLSFLEKEAIYRNLEIVTDLPPNLPHIESDRGQLQQVFLNLINNAFAAVDDGGRVSISAWEKDVDTVGVTVHDNGVGMSKETMKHIFDPFFTTKKGFGTGLGLSITYGIVKRLGGDIDVQSVPDVGSRFTVYLPKNKKEA